MFQPSADGVTTGGHVPGNAGIRVGIFCGLVELLLLFSVYAAGAWLGETGGRGWALALTVALSGRRSLG